MDSGAQSVMMDGLNGIRRWFVDNWALSKLHLCEATNDYAQQC